MKNEYPNRWGWSSPTALLGRAYGFPIRPGTPYSLAGGGGVTWRGLGLISPLRCLRGNRGPWPRHNTYFLYLFRRSLHHYRYLHITLLSLICKATVRQIQDISHMVSISSPSSRCLLVCFVPRLIPFLSVFCCPPLVWPFSSPPFQMLCQLTIQPDTPASPPRLQEFVVARGISHAHIGGRHPLSRTNIPGGLDDAQTASSGCLMSTNYSNYTNVKEMVCQWNWTDRKFHLKIWTTPKQRRAGPLQRPSAVPCQRIIKTIQIKFLVCQRNCTERKGFIFQIWLHCKKCSIEEIVFHPPFLFSFPHEKDPLLATFSPKHQIFSHSCPPVCFIDSRIDSPRLFWVFFFTWFLWTDAFARSLWLDTAYLLGLTTFLLSTHTQGYPEYMQP